MRIMVTRVLSGLGVLLLTCGLLAGVLNRELLDGDRFAEHVDAVRADPQVAQIVGTKISDELIAAQPELVSLRPLLETAATSVVGSDALGPVVRNTVAPLHRALVSGSSDQLLLRIADVGVVLVGTLSALDPDLSVSIPDDLEVTLADFSSQNLTAGLIDAAHLVALLAWLLPLLGVASLLLAGVVRGAGRRAWLRGVELCLYWVAGALVGVVLAVGVAVSFLDTKRGASAIVAAGWQELNPAVWQTAALSAAVATLVAVVNHPGFTINPRQVMRTLETWYTDPSPTLRVRLLRGALLAAAALMLWREPLTVVSAVLGLVALVLGLVAVRDLVVAAAQWIATAAPRTAARIEATLGSLVRRVLSPRGALAGATAVLVVAVAAGAWPQNTTLPLTSGLSAGCNGHLALCDRSYQDVSFVATHNSMSAADGDGWFLAEQPTGVTGQLQDGVRVFLIDAWPGQQTQLSSVIANSAASRARGLAQAEQAFGKDTVQAALRLRGALNLTPSGPIRPYLCHALCELGSTDWVKQMQEVRVWMQAHPREVVTFYIEDYVTPEQTARVFEEAGLSDLAHTQAADQPWPTLGQMIDSGRRLVIFNQSYTDPAYPWLLHGEGMVQDTPFTFRTVKQFSCAPNRGPRDARLFLMNHWLENFTSRVGDARRANARAVLEPRVKECARERGQRVNWVGINYYNLGDAKAVVNELNKV